MKASPTKGAPLRGRRCLVTGGGSGIGAAMPRRIRNPVRQKKYPIVTAMAMLRMG